ncbi:MAG: dTDP-4-dehydrorhamnose 3,5-epimerase, partial [Thermoplasmatales archaeon]
GVILIRRKIFPDGRGSLIKEFEETPFSDYFSTNFKEEYISVSKKYVLRGLHYQRNPKPQGKFISVIMGSIFDVAVDLREDSPNYLKYVSAVLKSGSGDSLWIPEGFAHGFLALEDNTIILNRCTNEFDPSLEGGIKWNDPKIGIEWPITKPILSTKDDGWALLWGGCNMVSLAV